MTKWNSWQHSHVFIVHLCQCSCKRRIVRNFCQWGNESYITIIVVEQKRRYQNEHLELMYIHIKLIQRASVMTHVCMSCITRGGEGGVNRNKIYYGRLHDFFEGRSNHWGWFFFSAEAECGFWHGIKRKNGWTFQGFNCSRARRKWTF